MKFIPMNRRLLIEVIEPKETRLVVVPEGSIPASHYAFARILGVSYEHPYEVDVGNIIVVERHMVETVYLKDPARTKYEIVSMNSVIGKIDMSYADWSQMVNPEEAMSDSHEISH